MASARLAFRTQNELDGHYVTFVKLDEPYITTLGEAIEYTLQVLRACSGVLQINPRFAAGGNFHLAALIGWTLGRKFDVRDMPDDPPNPLLLGDAREYLLRVMAAMKNPTHAGFWPWYWENCLNRGANAVEEQLVEVKRAWQADTSGTPQERAHKLLGNLRDRFQLMHDLCEVPRDRSIDYGHVAQVAHGVVADAIPKRPPAPEGRRSFTNLLADLDELERLLKVAPLKANGPAMIPPDGQVGPVATPTVEADRTAEVPDAVAPPPAAAATAPRLPPAARLAMDQFVLAMRVLPGKPRDKEVFKFLQLRPDEAGQLPKRFDTWSRNLRTARRLLDASKNRPRAGRGPEGSVVRASDL